MCLKRGLNYSRLRIIYFYILYIYQLTIGQVKYNKTGTSKVGAISKAQKAQSF